MKKKILTFLIVFVLLVSLTGCGSDNNNNDNDTSEKNNTQTKTEKSSNPANLMLSKDTNQGPIITGPQKYAEGETLTSHRTDASIREIIVLNSEGKYITSTNVNAVVRDAKNSYYEIYQPTDMEYKGSIKDNGKEYSYTLVIYNMGISNTYDFFNKYDIFNRIKTEAGMTSSELFDLTLKDIYNDKINDAIVEAVTQQNKTLAEVAETKTTGTPDQIDTIVSDKMYGYTKNETFVTASFKIIFDK